MSDGRRVVNGAHCTAFQVTGVGPLNVKTPRGEIKANGSDWVFDFGSDVLVLTDALARMVTASDFTLGLDLRCGGDEDNISNSALLDASVPNIKSDLSAYLPPQPLPSKASEEAKPAVTVPPPSGIPSEIPKPPLDPVAPYIPIQDNVPLVDQGHALNSPLPPVASPAMELAMLQMKLDNGVKLTDMESAQYFDLKSKLG